MTAFENGFRTDVKGCARCGQDHDDVEFFPLTNPADDWNFWRMCPVRNEPLMAAIVGHKSVSPMEVRAFGTTLEDALLEKLAALAHDEQWSGWMEYLFSKCTKNPLGLGTLLIPEDSVERWKRQMNTPYSELPEEERESDRVEARKVIELIRSALAGDTVAVGKDQSEGGSE